MAHTASNIFLDIKGFVDTSVRQAKEGTAARNYIDSQERITPFDNYNVWTEANRLHSIFPNNSFLNPSNQILIVNLLYIYSTANGGITVPNSLQNDYYNDGAVIVTNLLNMMFSPTSDTSNINENINRFLLSFANLSGNPNHRLLTSISLFGVVPNPNNVIILNQHAATMVVNDYLNPSGNVSFDNKIVKIIKIFRLSEEDLNNIINMYINQVSNKTRYLINILKLSKKDLRVICIELQNEFEHWVLTEHSPNIDDYYPRTLEPTVYQWLGSLGVIDSVVVLNEWSKDISVENLLNPNSDIYMVFLSLIDPIEQNKIVLSSNDPTISVEGYKRRPRYNRKCKHWKDKHYQKEYYE